MCICEHTIHTQTLVSFYEPHRMALKSQGMVPAGRWYPHCGSFGLSSIRRGFNSRLLILPPAFFFFPRVCRSVMYLSADAPRSASPSPFMLAKSSQRSHRADETALRCKRSSALMLIDARLKREKLFKTMMHVHVRARRHTHTVLGKLLCKRDG